MRETEIKIKYNVAEKQKIIDYCDNNGFEVKTVVEERDIYYTPMHINLMAEDRAVRLRYKSSSVDKTSFWEITYKGKNRSDVMNSREELETNIQDGEIIQQIFARLDFHILAEVYKHRIYYSKKNCNISIDTVESLGDYYEIEILGEPENTQDNQNRIKTMVKEIGLTNIKVEPMTYLELILRQGE